MQNTKKPSIAAGFAATIICNEQKKSGGLASCVYESLNPKGKKPSGYDFIVAALRIFYKKEFSEHELSEIITDGPQDEGIDAVYRNPDGYWDIFDFKTNNSCNDKDVRDFFESVRSNVLEAPKDYRRLRPSLAGALRRVHENGRSLPVRIFIVRGGVCESRRSFEKKKKTMQYESVKAVEFLDADDLIKRRFERESYTPVWHMVLRDESDLLFFDQGQPDELIVKLPVERVLAFFDECRRSNHDLFNKNVRAFLRDSQISEGISDSIKNKPGLLHKFHNGIKIVAQKILRDTDAKYFVHAPQVINGAQTINTIAAARDAGDLSPDQIARAYLVCKVYVADGDLTDALCQTSNTQAKVELSDLRSNDDVQVALELLINSVPGEEFDYRRKKPFKRKSNSIFMPEFTQWVCAALLERPADAKNKKRLLFDTTEGGLYEEIYSRPEIRDTKSVLRLCKIGVAVRNLVSRDAKKLPKIKSLLKSADLHILAGLYLLGDESAKRYPEVRDILVGYAEEKIAADSGLSQNKLFTKSQETWRHLRSELVRLEKIKSGS